MSTVAPGTGAPRPGAPWAVPWSAPSGAFPRHPEAAQLPRCTEPDKTVGPFCPAPGHWPGQAPGAARLPWPRRWKQRHDLCRRPGRRASRRTPRPRKVSWTAPSPAPASAALASSGQMHPAAGRLVTPRPASAPGPRAAPDDGVPPATGGEIRDRVSARGGHAAKGRPGSSQPAGRSGLRPGPGRRGRPGPRLGRPGMGGRRGGGPPVHAPGRARH